MDCEHSFYIANKKIAVYPSAEPDSPIVYLNTFGREGEKVLQALRKMNCPAFTLVTISGLTWDCDMAPWDIPPISKNDTPCAGGADEYLRLLTEEIIPKTERLLAGGVSWRGIAGYSLAGLFALYSVYQTDLISRVACMSASFWFPDFKEYILSHTMEGGTSHFYFSLGDKESHTKNPYLKSVQKNTEALASFYKQNGFDTVFMLNPGNHYQNAALRTAAGILWILSR